MRAIDTKVGCYVQVPARSVMIAGEYASVGEDIDTQIPVVIGYTDGASFDHPSDLEHYLCGAQVPDGDFDGYMVRPSQLHGRSWEMPATAPMTDEFGNFYTSLGYKGMESGSSNELVRSATAVSGFVPRGKLDGGAMARVLKGSELLRSIGVDTEWNQAFMQPEYQFVSGTPVDYATFRKAVVADTNRHYRSFKWDDVTVDPDDLVVMRRASLTPHRIADFGTDETHAALLQRAQEVFALYNEHIGPQNTQELPERLDHETPGDVLNYFERVLPTLLATNVATMHDHGIWHKFLTASNSYALGGIPDLDSLRSPTLGFGDRRPSPQQMRRDIEYQMLSPGMSDADRRFISIAPVFINLHEHGYYESPMDMLKGAFRYRESFENAYVVGRQRPDIRLDLDIAGESDDLMPRASRRILETLCGGTVTFRVDDESSMAQMWVEDTKGTVTQIGPTMDLEGVSSAYPEMNAGSLCYELYGGDEFCAPASTVSKLNPQRQEYAHGLVRTVYCNYLEDYLDDRYGPAI